MKRNPQDPEGQYESPQFCAEEGWCVTLTGERPNPTITDRAVELLRERERVGTENYGRPLFCDYKSFVGWIDDAIEESADKLQYLIAAREAAHKLWLTTWPGESSGRVERESNAEPEILGY